MAGATPLECWLFWFLNSQKYELADLLKMFPDKAMQAASQSLARIAEITEDKAMYDAREKARRDYEWQLSAARDEAREEGLERGIEKGLEKGREIGEKIGEARGKVEMIQLLQRLLLLPVTPEAELRSKSFVELQSLTSELQEQLRNRNSK